MRDPIRILLLADTHIGFDLPVRPRVQRRRRGHDFLANYARALAPALAREVDLVVHGGDVFDRSRVAASVAYQAYAPLIRVARGGVPVFIVPGNHERARLPHPGLASQAGVHVFDRARTFVADVRGERVALSGFPYQRREIRTRFGEVLESTGWQATSSRVRLLCMHHCVEGATVGPGDFTFTTGADVIRGRDVPADFAAVLSGHIHRHQVLTSDTQGRRLGAPVLYPGSIERTSVAERDEVKGFMIVETDRDGAGGVRWEFRHLRARPLLVRELKVDTPAGPTLDARIRLLLTEVPADAVLRIRVSGRCAPEVCRSLTAAHLRTLAPATMNIEIRAADGGLPAGRFKRRVTARDFALELPFAQVNGDALASAADSDPIEVSSRRTGGGGLPAAHNE